MRRLRLFGLSLVAALFTTTSLMAQTFYAPTTSGVDANKHYFAEIEIENVGVIKCELSAKHAPISVTNFIQLSKGGFYNGLTFHRVVPNFVIQGGDPDGNGTGGPGYRVVAEIQGNPLRHKKGALCWARDNNPKKESSGSQFYITIEETPFLDGDYTVFGWTVEGLSNIAKVKQGDKITKITITEQ